MLNLPSHGGFVTSPNDKSAAKVHFSPQTRNPLPRFSASVASNLPVSAFQTAATRSRSQGLTTDSLVDVAHSYVFLVVFQRDDMPLNIGSYAHTYQMLWENHARGFLKNIRYLDAKHPIFTATTVGIRKELWGTSGADCAESRTFASDNPNTDD